MIEGLIQRGWIQRCYARDAGGYRVDPHDSRATCWCLLGACMRAEVDFETGVRDLIRLAIDPDKKIMLPTWNDAPERTKEEVLEVIRRAKS
jgi:hypothetical protein